MKKTLVILVAMMIFCLCGCTNTAQTSKTTSESAAGETQPIAESTEILKEQDAQKSSDSTDSAEESGNVSKPLKEETTETQPAEESQSENESKPDSSFEQVKPSSGEAEAVTPSKPPETEKPKETERPKETAPPSPPVETKPEPEPEPEPSFDIDYWISYAQKVASSKGLILESDATASWDNPLTANPDCIYLERDLNARLSRYAKDEDITEVWIWYECVGTNSYLIYVGYA